MVLILLYTANAWSFRESVKKLFGFKKKEKDKEKEKEEEKEEYGPHNPYSKEYITIPDDNIEEEGPEQYGTKEDYKIEYNKLDEELSTDGLYIPDDDDKELTLTPEQK